MDTRQKILSPEEALKVTAALRSQGRRVDAVSGTFDVLMPDATAELSEFAMGGKLFALVTEPSQPLMSTRARCELAAALRVIDYVVPIEGSAADFVALMQPEEWFRFEERHEESTARLVQHVIERHD